MAKLVEGVHRFRADYFNRNRELFRTLAQRGQRPETLFITCSDARIDPNRITDSSPGDLFIVRNVGNIVPQLALPGGTSAALEYAVEVLQVSNIVVCGHTHCGAMEALLDPSRVQGLVYVQRWLSQALRLREESWPNDTRTSRAWRGGRQRRKRMSSCSWRTCANSRSWRDGSRPGRCTSAAGSMRSRQAR